MIRVKSSVVAMLLASIGLQRAATRAEVPPGLCALRFLDCTTDDGQYAALQEAHVAAINAELFARSKGAVPMLLTLLEDEPVGVNDFYVRYHTLQLLAALSASPQRLQEVRTTTQEFSWFLI